MTDKCTPDGHPLVDKNRRSLRWARRAVTKRLPKLWMAAERACTVRTMGGSPRRLPTPKQQLRRALELLEASIDG
jgi:hypothetical protein